MEAFCLASNSGKLRKDQSYCIVRVMLLYLVKASTYGSLTQYPMINMKLKVQIEEKATSAHSRVVA
jgi:hypothetical protein